MHHRLDFLSANYLSLDYHLCLRFKIKIICPPNYLIFTLFLLFAICSYVLGYFVQDYFHLKYLDKNYNQIVSENRQLRGEGKVIIQHIEDLKHSLIDLKTFNEKMRGLLSINVKQISKKTGVKNLQKLSHSNTGSSSPIFNDKNMLGTPRFINRPLY